MLVFDDILNQFKSHGFDSQSGYPFIYKGGEGLGIVLEINHFYYGTLKRLKIIYDEENLSKFLKFYTWYLNEGIKHGVMFDLENFSKLDTDFKFLYKNMPVDENNYLTVLNDYKEASSNELTTYKVLATELFNIYKYILKYINNYIISYNNLVVELHKLYKGFQSLVDIYNLNKINRVYNEVEFKKHEYVYDKEKERLLIEDYNKCDSVLAYKDIVNRLYKFCLELELSNSFLDFIEKKRILDSEYMALNKKIQYLTDIINNKKLVDLKLKMSRLDKKYKYTYNKKLNVNYRTNVLNRYKKYSSLILSSDNALSVVEEFNNVLVNDLKTRRVEKFIVKDKKINEKLLIFNSMYSLLIDLIMNVENYQFMNTTTLVSKLKENEEYNKLYNSLFVNVIGLLDKHLDNVLLNIFSVINFGDELLFIESIVKLINDVKNNTDYIDAKTIYYEDKSFILGYYDINNLKSDEGSYIIGQVSDLIRGIKLDNQLIIDLTLGIIYIKDDNKLLLFKDDLNIIPNGNIVAVANYLDNFSVEVNYTTVNNMKKVGDNVFSYCDIDSRF